MSLIALLVVTVVTGRCLNFESPSADAKPQSSHAECHHSPICRADNHFRGATARAQACAYARAQACRPRALRLRVSRYRTSEPAPEPVRQPAPSANSAPSEAVVLRAATTGRPVVHHTSEDRRGHSAAIAAGLTRDPRTASQHAQDPATAPVATNGRQRPLTAAGRLRRHREKTSQKSVTKCRPRRSYR